MINFDVKPVEGFDKELCLVREGYLARPVTVDQTTISGLTPTDKGRYIIPQGTYLFGSNGTSLLLDPNQVAAQVAVTEVLASAKVGTGVTGASSTGTVVVTAKTSGALVYTLDIKKGTDTTPDISYASGTKTITINLAVDSNDDVTTTYSELVFLINNDSTVNSFVTAELVSSDYEDTVVLEETGADVVATAGGGTETVASDVDGILYHSVDVTDGEATGALMIAGVVNIDNLAVEPGAALKAKLPNIIFGRRD